MTIHKGNDKVARHTSFLSGEIALTMEDSALAVGYYPDFDTLSFRVGAVTIVDSEDVGEFLEFADAIRAMRNEDEDILDEDEAGFNLRYRAIEDALHILRTTGTSSSVGVDAVLDIARFLTGEDA